MTASNLPVAFHDLRRDQFPFTIEMFDVDTDKVYDTSVVEGPGVMRVNRKPDYVRLAGTRITFATGEVVEHRS